VRPAELHIEGDANFIRATVLGEVDMSNAAELRSEISAAVPNDATALVLDLTSVDYMDSAGLHLVHHLRESLRARGQSLLLVIPEGSVVHTALRLSGLDWHEHIAPSLRAARAALGA
jgi:anti-sigma B factor antagonist